MAHIVLNRFIGESLIFVSMQLLPQQVGPNIYRNLSCLCSSLFSDFIIAVNLFR